MRAQEIADTARGELLDSVRAFGAPGSNAPENMPELPLFQLLGGLLPAQQLTHTTYFGVEAFRKLVVYALARQTNLKLSPEFRSDPLLPDVERWFDEIRPPLRAEP